MEATLELIRWFITILHRLPRQHPLHLIQLQTRLLHEFSLIDLRRYEHARRLIAAIGRQHSGWISQQQRVAA
jgi:hypothetical protein